MKTEHRVLLSGTPMQNNIGELLAVLKFAIPHVFQDGAAAKRQSWGTVGKGAKRPRYQDFADYFTQMAVGGDKQAKSAALRQIRKIMRPFVLRRLKCNVLSRTDLAPKESVVVRLDMEGYSVEAYTSVLAQAKAQRAEALALRQASKTLLGGGGGGRKKTAQKKGAAATYRIGNVFSELRKAANHPLLLQRKFSSQLPEIISEARRVGVFDQNGDRSKQCSLKTMQGFVAKMSDLDLNLAFEDFQHVSPLYASLVLPKSAFLESPKMQWLLKNLPKLYDEGHRVLIFSQWTKLLDVIEYLLEDQLGETFYRLDGSNSVDGRQDMIDSFNAPGCPSRTFLLSTRAGGMGINVTSADTVILHDVDFNPTVDRQAEDRVHRIGQKKKVTIYRLVCNGTVDQVIAEKAEQKSVLNRHVLRDGAAASSASDGLHDPFEDMQDDEDEAIGDLLEKALAMM
jgi:SWI/SNF-related matrix-associated actin-dependent regulator 1 of chromatin subfamily A